MSDSDITIKVAAETAQAVTNLRNVSKQTEQLGKTATTSASQSTGAVLQLSGSVLSLKNGLSSLAQGRGGVGALLQVGGSALSAKNAMAGLGATGVGTGAAIAAGFLAAAAAVVGVGHEVTKASIGTEEWKKQSTAAVDRVIGSWGRAKTAVSDYWKETAVGSFFAERALQKKQAEVAAVKEQVLETERINALTGDALKMEIRIAEEAGDAAKVAQLYTKSRKEAADQAKKEKEELIETQNILEKNSVWQDKANKEGAEIERKEQAFAKARAIAAQQEPVEGGQAQQLDKMKDLIGPAIGARIQTAITRANPGTESVQQQADPSAKRQLDNTLVNLAKSGVAMETLVTTLGDNGMGQEEIVTTLENLEKRLPAGFGDELLKHIKPGVIVWQ